MYGYTTASSKTQRDWEKKFQDGISRDNLRESMRRLTARPHHVGSPYDKDNAEWILARFKEWGFDARIETFQVLFPTPKERLVEMLEPTQFQAKLQEPMLPIDPTSNQTAEQFPTTTTPIPPTEMSPGRSSMSTMAGAKTTKILIDWASP